MSWVMIIVLIVASYLILLPLLSYLSARRLVGKMIENDLTSETDGNRMIYFYSQKCPPCRSMTPIIDHLSENHDTVMKVDVQSDPDTARAFNIRATPTTILMKDNKVTDVCLGAKSQKQLETLLQKII
ncbi:MAG: thioredoxin family protein [Candidatus Thiodiazotropha sp. (ex Codakia rugifera)]|nr:thioredoxin family protein [Candidatus Thiodiazotropha sp. (ex Codakia rugifera)]